MKFKKTMLATALAAFAFAALPALASAQPGMEINGSPHFTVENDVEIVEEKEVETPTELHAGSTTVECKKVTGTGEFEDPNEDGIATTGTIEFTFHECREKTFGTPCTTGASSETIETTKELPFHLVTATRSDGSGGHEQTDAVLITPAKEEGKEVTEGHFATFTCFFHTIKIEVEGTGIIGEITEPNTGEESATFTVDFDGENGTQKWEHICKEGGGTSEHTYDLTAIINGGEPETAVQTGSGTGVFTEGKNKLIKD